MHVYSTHTYIHAYIHTSIHTYIYVYLYVHIYTRMHMHTRGYMHVHKDRSSSARRRTTTHRVRWSITGCLQTEHNHKHVSCTLGGLQPVSWQAPLAASCGWHMLSACGLELIWLPTIWIEPQSARTTGMLPLRVCTCQETIVWRVGMSWPASSV